MGERERGRSEIVGKVFGFKQRFDEKAWLCRGGRTASREEILGSEVYSMDGESAVGNAI